MNGFTFKTAAIMLSIALLSSLSYANSTVKKIYGTKLGCMACHQGAPLQPEKTTKKNHSNQKQTAPTKLHSGFYQLQE
jgi:hypothetical protein